ncbi:hypothetical protein HDU87_007665 [Geranomyces variabilis]|uniref:Uncharacterized protein n=1 Tax=Geranomyces variabilis TaxID=109894 RepID=A0AAD5TF23_9FUNG|nr:hypothetical protein HDU87_007665 [Geranomyces variabilis]
MSASRITKSHSATHSSRQSYLTAARQSRSQQDYPTATLTLDSFVNIVTSTVKERMASLNLATAGINQTFLDFLMPPPDDRLIRAAEMLMHIPVSVSDRDMVDALQLQEVGPDFEAIDGWEYYYIRSWAVAADDLGLILAYWEEEGIQAPEAWSWAFNVAVGTAAAAAAAPRVCHIRYVGKCTGPSTPWKRLQADLERVSGLPPEFCTALNKFAPDVYEDVKVYEVHRARLQEHAAEHIRDNRERALISFFGLPTLLNRQPGGFFASYVPSLTDQGLFESLGTKVFAAFRTASSVATTTTTDNTQLQHAANTFVPRDSKRP